MTCSKIPFTSKYECSAFIQEVRKDARHRRERGPKFKKKLRPYKCPYCEQWHTTTQKPRKW